MRLVASVLVILSFLALPLRAQNLIRDADIEHALSQLARPILQSAGLNPNQDPHEEEVPPEFQAVKRFVIFRGMTQQRFH